MKRLFPIILLLVFVAVGCKLPGFLRDMTSGGTSKGGSSSGTATGGSDPREDVVQASKKFIALPYFTANMEGVGQTEIKSQVAFAAPDRFHVKYLGGTGSGMEMIFIGKEMYMNANGKWTKMPSTNTSIPTLRDSFTEEGLKTLTDVSFEGEDSVDGKPALAYSYKNVTPVGNYPFTSKIWVGKETGLPMKIYVEYTNGTLKNMTVNYDTETPVTIEPPIK
jgi:outer membrane lipoprotein-sorting protein